MAFTPPPLPADLLALLGLLEKQSFGSYGGGGPSGYTSSAPIPKRKPLPEVKPASPPPVHTGIDDFFGAMNANPNAAAALQAKPQIPQQQGQQMQQRWQQAGLPSAADLAKTHASAQQGMESARSGADAAQSGYRPPADKWETLNRVVAQPLKRMATDLVPGALTGGLGLLTTGAGAMAEGVGDITGNESLANQAKAFKDTSWDKTRAGLADVRKFFTPGHHDDPSYRRQKALEQADKLQAGGHPTAAGLTEGLDQLGATTANLAVGAKATGVNPGVGQNTVLFGGYPAYSAVAEPVADRKLQHHQGQAIKRVAGAPPEVQAQLERANEASDAEILATIPPGPPQDAALRHAHAANAGQVYRAWRRGELTGQATEPTTAPDLPGGPEPAIAESAVTQPLPEHQPAVAEKSPVPSPVPSPAGEQGWGNAWKSLLGGNLGEAWGQTPGYGKVGMGVGGALLLIMLLKKLFGNRKKEAYTQEERLYAQSLIDRMLEKDALVQPLRIAPRSSRMGRGPRPDQRFVAGHNFQGSQTRPVRTTGADQKIDQMMGTAEKLAMHPLLSLQLRQRRNKSQSRLRKLQARTQGDKPKSSH